MVKKVERWLTDDGTLYPTESLAKNHDENVLLAAYIDAAPIFAADNGKVGGDEFLRWLCSNTRVYCMLLKEEGNQAT